MKDQRCPRCGMSQEGTGIMCARADAGPLRWVLFLWAMVGIGLFVLAVSLVAQ